MPLPHAQFQLPELFDLGATFAFALTGALAAIKRGYDIVGVFFLALVSGLGGGLIRDGVGELASRGVLGAALDNPSTGYSVVYHIEIYLLFATLIALGPLVRVRRTMAGQWQAASSNPLRLAR